MSVGQVKREWIVDEEAGYVVDNMLSIKITIRILSPAEAREYHGRKQVVIPFCIMHSCLLPCPSCYPLSG